MSGLSFTAPWLLLALCALPALYWLLRAVPPAPAERRFGGLFFLRGLKDERQTPARTPWWLLALRLLAAAAVIVALAGPMLNAPRPAEGTGPVLYLIDDGWTAAPGWRARQEEVAREAERPGAEGREAYLLFAAAQAPSVEGPMTPSDAARAVRAHEPSARLPDWDAAADALRRTGLTGLTVRWLSGSAMEDGPGRQRLLGALSRAGDAVMVRVPQEEALAVTGLETQVGALEARLTRVAGTLPPREAALRVTARDGRTLAVLPFAWGEGEAEARVPIELPLTLRNQAGILSIEGVRSAGATWLVDASARRSRAGLVTDGTTDSLLTSGTYLAQALEPLAVLSRGTPEELTQSGADLIVLDDVGTLRPEAERALTAWLREGGLLLRFAGPDTANAERTDGDTFPAPLRAGGRSFGGALTWETPQPLAGFERESPLGGLAVPDDVIVRRQVLTRTTPGQEVEVWASLADGTPLVSARRVGDGLTVLFHVTASPTWSDLPLSGVFPAMIRRIVSLAGQGAQEALPNTPVPALRLLSGFGDLEEPAGPTPPATPARIARREAAPGLYGAAAAPLAVNAWEGEPALLPAGRGLPAGLRITSIEGEAARRLGAPLLAGAVALLLVDALLLAGLSLGARRGAVAALAGLVLLPLGADPAAAQPRPPLSEKSKEAADQVRFAFVETGDASLDRISRAGLFGLTREAIRRSALEPGQPIGVDIERDDLSVYPLLYWMLTSAQAPPSDAALSKLEAFMAGGGLLIIDTADGERAQAGAASPEAGALREVLRRMDTPPLEPLPPGHILTVSFYRLDDLPGRNSGGPVWVEAEGALRETTDSVPSLVIGGRDWASAWAVDEGGVPLRPAGAGGERRREAAYRAGINMAMVALTGNYKGDQIHVQELLDRIEETP
ncbi:DUF4159 domain-containing protein [Parvularcula dongshanensis]|uniref:DUF4159 domain-containing protein n=1 Tax=Parvularcula dongshanensis TaxID=1173995 RepID=A0A840I0Z1_9PROT|nr:hypothetical protein [Parvularcula dongshanensis]